VPPDAAAEEYARQGHLSSTTVHVGADVLICPVERSSTGSCVRENSGAPLRRADEDICPYADCG